MANPFIRLGHRPFSQGPRWRMTVLRSATLTALTLSSAAWAQTAAPVAPVALPPVIVTERPYPPTADVTGFGEYPLREVPASATVIDARTIRNSGARRLADLTQFDASVTDAYNAPGYWDYLSIRGFTLDNRFNYRREGLPISAETSIPLDNKSRIEVLRGTSGIQAGTSAPGGLVNYVVKRPTDHDLREVRLEFTQRASVLVAADLGGRFGKDAVFGYRLNAATETLRPRTAHLDGKRQMLALATDWRISPDSLLEAEVEWSHKSQPSQTGFSLLGNRLPAPVDPRRNLNSQPWSQPSVFDALTGSVRFAQKINAAWSWSAQLGSQRLRTDDRTAFPFGCYDGAADNYYADRFCPDGNFDLYDYRSDNESRTQQAASLRVQGKFDLAGTQHDIAVSLMSSRVRQRFEMQAYNWVGNINVDAPVNVAPDPTRGDQNTNRDERSVELSLQDRVRWTPHFSTWFGLRHSNIQRDSVRTNGSRPTSSSSGGLTTPWAALSYQVNPAHSLYASYGQGLESQVVPNRPAQYTNPGVTLPALKSTQWEAGARGGQDALSWQLAWFQIERPMSNLDACSRLGLSPCLGQYDGSALHRGLEASTQWTAGAWRWQGAVTLVDAKRQDSKQEPANNGKRPANVPATVLRAAAIWKAPAVHGLEWQASLSHEGNRPVLPDASITLPAWTRIDTALRYTTRIGGAQTTWALGVDNLFDKRYWRESPYQFGHVYLYPGAARTLRLSLHAAL